MEPRNFLPYSIRDREIDERYYDAQMLPRYRTVTVKIRYIWCHRVGDNFDFGMSLAFFVALPFAVLFFIMATTIGAQPMGIALVICGTIAFIALLIVGAVIGAIWLEGRAKRVSDLATAKVQHATAKMQIDNLTKASNAGFNGSVADLNKELTVRSMIGEYED